MASIIHGLTRTPLRPFLLPPFSENESLAVLAEWWSPSPSGPCGDRRSESTRAETLSLRLLSLLDESRLALDPDRLLLSLLVGLADSRRPSFIGTCSTLLRLASGESDDGEGLPSAAAAAAASFLADSPLALKLSSFRLMYSVSDSRRGLLPLDGLAGILRVAGIEWRCSGRSLVLLGGG